MKKLFQPAVLFEVMTSAGLFMMAVVLVHKNYRTGNVATWIIIIATLVLFRWVGHKLHLPKLYFTNTPKK